MNLLKLATTALFVITITACGTADNSSELQGQSTEESVAKEPITDGTISYEQPDSKGLFSSEGFCGQTAAANIATMMNGVDVIPSDVSKECYDYTPGTRPATLQAYLEKKTTVGHWSVVTTNEEDAMDDLFEAVHNSTHKAKGLNITPIAVVVNYSGGTFTRHWITVVKVDRVNERVYFNHWEKQIDRTFEEFNAMWKTGGLTGVFSPYTFIDQD